jgi:glycosyltransferase involved in cell wall biosynthesis
MIETNPKQPTLCIGVLAMNEAHRLAACLESAQFAQQIILVDSGSTDNTRELAQDLGAQVHLYDDWQGFAVQRNRLLAHVQTDYIFFLDADEVISVELQQEIQNAVASGKDAVWEIQWNQVAYGKPLSLMKSTGGIRRLFKTGNIIQFEGVVHEGAKLHNPQTPVYRFKHRLLHYSRETVYGSLLKLAQYVQLGAAKRAALGKRGGVLRGFASALAIFLKLYVFRRGFLCGPQGFLFCFFIALECFFRYAALKYDSKHLKTDLAKR